MREGRRLEETRQLAERNSTKIITQVKVSNQRISPHSTCPTHTTYSQFIMGFTDQVCRSRLERQSYVGDKCNSNKLLSLLDLSV